MKSLYTRIVLIFVSIVMFSLFAAFLISSWLFDSRAQSLIEDILTTNGNQIIHTYQSTPEAELIPFMESLSGLSLTDLQLYDPTGKPLVKQSVSNVQVEPNDIARVIAGEKVSDIKMNIHNTSHTANLPVIGLPFQVDGQPYALFVTIKRNDVDVELMNSIHFMYVLILFLGSFLILIAARYIVTPIHRLTEATKHMAKGNFDVMLPTNRKDEIGALSMSFNEMAKELSKLDQMRLDFVSNVSHEIQSPLTSISGFSKALKHKKLSEENRLHYLTIIEKESERLSRLSQNLLRLSYLQHESAPLKVSRYRLDEQLRKVMISLEPLWAEKGIEIILHLEPITIEADEDQLSQVWVNLLSNSIKFTPAQGKIWIEACAKNHQHRVSITDNGIGIPEEERKNIFKPFHKVDRARNSSIKGNGLGLAIVKKIIDIHKGDIQVSGKRGTGATFEVTLPH